MYLQRDYLMLPAQISASSFHRASKEGGCTVAYQICCYLTRLAEVVVAAGVLRFEISVLRTHLISTLSGALILCNEANA